MVSVIIPNYNHAPYLKQRIDSVLNQTYTEFEVIILDDCSTDNSKEIIEQYRTHPKIAHIIYNEQNSGSTFKQWNKGVALAKGDHIWIAESDDVADKRLLEVLMSNLNANTEACIAFCQSYRLNAAGEITGDWKDWSDDLDEQLFKTDYTMAGKKFISDLLLYKNVLPNASAVVFKKQLFNDVNQADADIEYCADWLLWLKMLCNGDILYVADKLNYFRYHEASVIAGTGTNNFYLKKYNTRMRIKYNAFLSGKKDTGLNNIASRNIDLLISESLINANHCLARHNFSIAFYFFKASLVYAKGNKRTKAAKMFMYNFFKSLVQPVKQLTAV